MAEYIKRSEAMSICQQYSSHCFTTNDASGQDIADRIENDIVEIPTADVVEVVRCKDCKHFTAGYCCRDIKGRSQMHYMGEEAFCSYGERRTDNDL